MSSVPIALSTIFEIDCEEFVSAKSCIDSSFDQTAESPSDGFYAANPRNWLPRDPNVQLILKQRLSDPNQRIGVDLPWLLSVPAAKLTVMIVGKDPLRKYADFSCNARWSGSIIIGTPYAIHSDFYKDRTKIYQRVITELKLLGCNIYLTDAKKMWIGGATFSSRLDLEALRKELESIRPDFVIAFGVDALRAIETVENATDCCAEAQSAANNRLNRARVLSFPHPSRAANGAWLRRLGGSSPIDERKIEHILEKFRFEIDSLARHSRDWQQ